MAASQISCVILAGGRSERFGANKLTAELVNGKAMLEQVIEVYGSVFKTVSVVAGEQLESSIIKWGGAFIESEQRHLGMSQSLIAGVKQHADDSAIIVGLGDMPYVQENTLRSLLLNASTSSIVVPEYQSQRGNPVVLGQDFFDDIYALSGDVGAKPLLIKHPDKVVRISVDDFGVCHDIDRPDQILL